MIVPPVIPEPKMKKFEQLVLKSARELISDLHIISGMPLVFRKNGSLLKDETAVWSPGEIDKLVAGLMTSRDRNVFEERMSVDFARTINHVRIRINVFNSTAGKGMAIRLLPAQTPTIGMLNLHPSLKDYCKIRDGLILVCGSTGVGKSGTIAAMIEEINRTTASRIITLEDPVEYQFVSRKSVITQRELGTHFPSFARGILDVLREDADVIVVGELRDPETMRLALDAAESGHVVITTVHASNSEDALHRISNSFAPEAQAMVRSQLASTLSTLIVQKLVLHRAQNYRIPVLSILRGTQSVKALIRDNRLVQLESAMQTGKQSGMFTMESYEEYIYSHLDLRPPSMAFDGTAEHPPEGFTEFHIRVTTPGQTDRQGLAPRGADSLTQPVSAGSGDGSKARPSADASKFPGPKYVIQEESSMEDIINEMKKRRPHSGLKATDRLSGTS